MGKKRKKKEKWDFEPKGIKVLRNKTLIKINISRNGDKDYLKFITNEGEQFLMTHDQECCESVTIEDICGDLKDLLNTPILKASCRTNEGEETEDGTSLWTFYKLATIKGSVDIRWYGSSNGYYSESVDILRKVE